MNALPFHPTSPEIPMPVEQPSPGYSSFLLRLRRVGNHPAIWHVSLQDVRTGEWHHFMDLPQLFASENLRFAEGSGRKPLLPAHRIYIAACGPY